MASKYPEPTRADDERLLDWLRRNDNGVSFAQIGRRYGVTRSVVAGAIRRVRTEGDQ